MWSSVEGINSSKCSFSIASIVVQVIVHYVNITQIEGLGCGTDVDSRVNSSVVIQVFLV